MQRRDREGDRMYPKKEEAERLLREAEKCNPGPWGDHSRTAARCAERIASSAGLDPEKAYVLGLLHDIGRKFGKRHLGHVSDGYAYMASLGYDDAARICLTHSFHTDWIEGYVGNFDTSDEETDLIRVKLRTLRQDDYDRLIRLCDAIAGAGGVMKMEDRMRDVRNRYGSYDPEKWEANLELRREFERRMGRDLYEVVSEDPSEGTCGSLEKTGKRRKEEDGADPLFDPDRSGKTGAAAACDRYASCVCGRPG